MKNLLITSFAALAACAASAATVKTATQPWVEAKINAATTNLATKADLDAAGKVKSVNGATGDVTITAASLGALTAETDPSTGLTNGTAYVRGKKVVSAESDPNFAAWKDDVSIAAGKDASAYFGGVVLGKNARGGGIVIGRNADSGPSNNLIIGDNARSGYVDSIVIGYFTCSTGADERQTTSQGNGTFNISTADPAHFWFGAAGYDADANPIKPRTLQSYLNERVEWGSLTNEVNALTDGKAKRYALVVPTAFSKSSPIAAADATLYAVDADASGVYLTLPAATKDYTQDFALRVGLASGATNTALSVTIPTGMTADYPLGTNAINGTIIAPTYFTFTQTAPTKWSITAYAATKEDK